MGNQHVLDRVTAALIEINRKDTIAACNEAMAKGILPERVMKALSDGMTIIGERFGIGEAFISELMMAGVILKDAQKIIEPYLKLERVTTTGRVVIGTVEGDLHDIGKNIVSSFLFAAGFEVHDLGTDVSADSFIEKVRETDADVLGMSALLGTSLPFQKTVIEELEKEGLRNGVKVIIGGAPVSEEFAQHIGADGYGADGFQAVAVVESLSDTK